MAAVGIVPANQNNPATGTPLGPGFVAGAGAVTGTAALGTPLPAAGPVTAPVAIPPLAPAIASTAALGLTGVGPHFAAVPGTVAGGDSWVAAYNKASRLQAYMNNSVQVGEKANEFRTLMVDRLRGIYWRLQSIQAAAGAANQAQQALITLVDTINAAGGPTDAQNAAMHDLAAELQNIDIPNMITGLVNEINNLANQVGLVAGQKVANDTSLIPMTGGRRRRKKKKSRKRKGGYKFTRAANSRRSLRMKTRKRRSRRRRRKHRRRSRHKRR